MNDKENKSSYLLATVISGMSRRQCFRISVIAGILVLGTGVVRLSHEILSQSSLGYSGSGGRSVDCD